MAEKKIEVDLKDLLAFIYQNQRLRMGENFQIEQSIWEKQEGEVDQAPAGSSLIYKEISLC